MNYTLRKKAIILLEDGTIFHGKAVGNRDGKAFGEVCFNTGMSGYQEIITDPSYYGQLMISTNTHIGNYGIMTGEEEADKPQIAGLICKNFSYNYSRAGAEQSLDSFLEENSLFAISDVDTRALVIHIRENGAMNAVISSEVDDIDKLKRELAETPHMDGLELVSKVSTNKPYYHGEETAKHRVAVLDMGVKRGILRHLAARNSYCKVFPYDTSFEEMEAWKPDGYLLSNGPGDPRPLENVIQVARQIIEQDKPLFGICLGHQLIALANGISSYKMHNGHRGINHPVLNLQTGKGEITSQNHGFAVNREDAQANSNVEITHTHLNDQSVAGIRVKNKNCFSVQYHPEASPGPNDAHYLFDEFIQNIVKEKNR